MARRFHTKRKRTGLEAIRRAVGLAMARIPFPSLVRAIALLARMASLWDTVAAFPKTGRCCNSKRWFAISPANRWQRANPHQSRTLRIDRMRSV